MYIPKYTVSNTIATNTWRAPHKVNAFKVPTTPGPQVICDLIRLFYVNWCCIAKDMFKDVTVCLYINTKHKFTHSRLN